MINIENNMLFAIPKKGRLSEQCLEYLKRIGLSFRKNERSDISLCNNFPIAIVFLPAHDIPLYIGTGRVDIGITGEDILYESELENEINVLLKLGFGKCTLSLAVPVNSNLKVSDFENKKIVTSFPNLTKKFFSKNNINNILIKTVSGSVEIACTMGAADGITDLVQTGDTMKEAGLKVIASILETEAILISRKKSSYKNLIDKLKARMEGVVNADIYALIEYNVERKNLAKCEKITPGLKSPTIMPLEDENWVAVKSVINKKDINEIIDSLKGAGAQGILLSFLEHCRM